MMESLVWCVNVAFDLYFILYHSYCCYKDLSRLQSSVIKVSGQTAFPLCISQTARPFMPNTNTSLQEAILLTQWIRQSRNSSWSSPLTIFFFMLDNCTLFCICYLTILLLFLTISLGCRSPRYRQNRRSRADNLQSVPQLPWAEDPHRDSLQSGKALPLPLVV